MGPGTGLGRSSRNTAAELSVSKYSKNGGFTPQRGIGPHSNENTMSILFRPHFAPKISFSAARLEGSR